MSAPGNSFGRQITVQLPISDAQGLYFRCLFTAKYATDGLNSTGGMKFEAVC